MTNFLGSWANIPEHNYLAHCSVRQVIVVPGCYFAQQPGKRLLGALFGTKRTSNARSSWVWKRLWPSWGLWPSCCSHFRVVILGVRNDHATPLLRLLGPCDDLVALLACVRTGLEDFFVKTFYFRLLGCAQDTFGGLLRKNLLLQAAGLCSGHVWRASS